MPAAGESRGFVSFNDSLASCSVELCRKSFVPIDPDLAADVPEGIDSVRPDVLRIPEHRGHIPTDALTVLVHRDPLLGHSLLCELGQLSQAHPAGRRWELRALEDAQGREPERVGDDDQLIERDVASHLVVEVLDIEVPVVVEPGRLSDRRRRESEVLSRFADAFRGR